jgi:tripartite-type tricarboxylate transporter receptor subunit TctC
VQTWFALASARAGKVRAIAVTGARRAEPLPDVPTVAESGSKGYELNAALKSPDVVQQLKDQGIDAAPTSPDEFTRYIAPEEKKWGPIIRKSNIKVE